MIPPPKPDLVKIEELRAYLAARGLQVLRRQKLKWSNGVPVLLVVPIEAAKNAEAKETDKK